MRLSAAITVFGLLLTAVPAGAVPVIGSGAWQTAGPAQENFSAYWDGKSWDTYSTFEGQPFNPCNAGSLVSGIACGLKPSAQAAAAAAGLTVSSYSMAGPTGPVEYWGHADGSADLSFYFGEATGARYDFSLLGEFTADWAVNEVGWYSVDNPQQRGVIFSDLQTVGAASSVYIPGNFGIYYRNTSGNGEMYFTQSGYNAWGDRQQFAVFQVGEMNYVGVEDIFSNLVSAGWIAGASDYDFNDNLIGFQRANVPEPSSLLLVGLGLAAAASRRRVRARPSPADRG